MVPSSPEEKMCLLTSITSLNVSFSVKVKSTFSFPSSVQLLLSGNTLQIKYPCVSFCQQSQATPSPR